MAYGSPVEHLHLSVTAYSGCLLWGDPSLSTSKRHGIWGKREESRRFG